MKSQKDTPQGDHGIRTADSEVLVEGVELNAVCVGGVGMDGAEGPELVGRGYPAQHLHRPQARRQEEQLPRVVPSNFIHLVVEAVVAQDVVPIHLSRNHSRLLVRTCIFAAVGR